jgi:hypothetical protein
MQRISPVVTYSLGSFITTYPLLASGDIVTGILLQFVQDYAVDPTYFAQDYVGYRTPILN